MERRAKFIKPPNKKGVFRCACSMTMTVVSYEIERKGSIRVNAVCDKCGATINVSIPHFKMSEGAAVTIHRIDWRNVKW